MAEFCVDCWNEINNTNDPCERFILTGHLELCEGCGQQKRTIAAIRKAWRLRRWFMQMVGNRKKQRS